MPSHVNPRASVTIAALGQSKTTVSTTLHYKFATRSEIHKLPRFYANVFNRQIENLELAWRFIDNPLLDDSYYNYVAIDTTGEIVGHTAALPINYIQHGQLLKGALSVGSGVTKEYGGLFPKLYADLESRLLADGFDFVLAFPNQNSFPFFVKSFNFQDPFFNYLQLELTQLSQPRASFASSFNFEGLANYLGDEYLTWRLADSPINDYQVFEHSCFEVAYKVYQDREVDLIYMRLKQTSFDWVAFVDFLAALPNVAKVNVYSSNPAFSDALWHMGFRPVTTKNKLVVKALRPSVLVEPIFIQMIDSDVL